MSSNHAKKWFPFTESVLAFTLTLCVSVDTQSQLKTVTDFYLALPTSFNVVKNMDENPFREGFFFDEFYENEKTTSRAAILKHRKGLIKIEDIRNGYLRLQPKGLDGWEEIALFKKTDGRYLVALSQIECGPGCSGDVMFLAYSRGIWTNVTKQVFPSSPSSDEGYFKLPRSGTTIELICGDESNEDCQVGKSLAKFPWNKAKFTREVPK